ncbi:MAG: hypothetical protein ABJD97_13280 [Betaproteobacteria bacterium]
MKISLRQLVLASTMLAVTASFSLPSLAQDVRREDMVLFFHMDKIDANKNGMVSKREFLDSMSKAWDMHMADVAKMDADKMGSDKMAAAKAPSAKSAKQEMTRAEYLEFSKMFGLNIGG